MITKFITAGAKLFNMEAAAFAICFSFIAAGGIFTGAYYLGDKNGNERCQAAWEKGVDKAEDRAADSANDFAAGAGAVPAVIERETQTIYRVDDTAVKEVARLEAQIEDLKWELENDKVENVCSGLVPEPWRMQHDKADRFLSGLQ